MSILNAISGQTVNARELRNALDNEAISVLGLKSQYTRKGVVVNKIQHIPSFELVQVAAEEQDPLDGCLLDDYKPGSPERIAQLAEFYASQEQQALLADWQTLPSGEGDNSPFVVTDEEMADAAIELFNRGVLDFGRLCELAGMKPADLRKQG